MLHRWEFSLVEFETVAYLRNSSWLRDKWISDKSAEYPFLRKLNQTIKFWETWGINFDRSRLFFLFEERGKVIVCFLLRIFFIENHKKDNLSFLFLNGSSQRRRKLFFLKFNSENKPMEVSYLADQSATIKPANDPQKCFIYGSHNHRPRSSLWNLFVSLYPTCLIATRSPGFIQTRFDPKTHWIFLS